MRVGIYARSGSEGCGVEIQLQTLRSLCKKKGYTIAGEYADYHTPANAGKPEYEKLLGDVRSGKIDCIACYSLDRLTRNTKQLYCLIDDLYMANVKIMTFLESIEAESLDIRVLRLVLEILDKFRK